MKRIFKVLLVLLLLVIVLTAFVYDFTKVRETPIGEVKSIAENRENQKIEEICMYIQLKMKITKYI